MRAISSAWKELLSLMSHPCTGAILSTWKLLSFPHTGAILGACESIESVELLVYGKNPWRVERYIRSIGYMELPFHRKIPGTWKSLLGLLDQGGHRSNLQRVKNISCALATQ